MFIGPNLTLSTVSKDPSVCWPTIAAPGTQSTTTYGSANICQTTPACAGTSNCSSTSIIRGYSVTALWRIASLTTSMEWRVTFRRREGLDEHESLPGPGQSLRGGGCDRRLRDDGRRQHVLDGSPARPRGRPAGGPP